VYLCISQNYIVTPKNQMEITGNPKYLKVPSGPLKEGGVEDTSYPVPDR